MVTGQQAGMQSSLVGRQAGSSPWQAGRQSGKHTEKNIHVQEYRTYSQCNY